MESFALWQAQLDSIHQTLAVTATIAPLAAVELAILRVHNFS
ncbi:hypothetical protein BV133_2463 [Blastochloris viridis]|uniref:Uncharacterized protein n=1 Tax=Blastochloris viridis TaxID=1079 RepID=A0A182D3H1_BLAVI|nr:hypothetical protein BV133_2463 [Blastochloris viridis]